MYHLLVALQFLTRIPMPKNLNPSIDDMGKSGRYIPLVGAILGSLCYAIFQACIYAGISGTISICIAIVTGMLLTGGFHEDGLADTFDGFGGAFDSKRKLEIMKDSRIGTYGTLAVISILALRFLTLKEVPNIHMYAAFVIPFMIGRLSSIVIIPHTKYSSIDSLSKSKPVIEGIGSRHYIIPALYTCALCFFLVGPLHTSIIFLISIVIGALLRLVSKRQIEGITGDVLGAINVLIEVSVLIYLSTI